MTLLPDLGWRTHMTGHNMGVEMTWSTTLRMVYIGLELTESQSCCSSTLLEGRRKWCLLYRKVNVLYSRWYLGGSLVTLVTQPPHIQAPLLLPPAPPLAGRSYGYLYVSEPSSSWVGDGCMGEKVGRREMPTRATKKPLYPTVFLETLNILRQRNRARSITLPSFA